MALLSDERAEDVKDDLQVAPNFPDLCLKPRLPTRTRGESEVVTRDLVVRTCPVEKDAEHKGVMVALRIPMFAALRVALPGGEPPEDLHCTLAYLGDADELDPDRRADLVERLKAVAATTPPLSGTLTGYGRFRIEEDGEDVLWVGLDAPDLPTLRHRVAQACRDALIPPAGDHGFTPHVTLAYVPAGEGEDSMPAPTEVEFKWLSLVVAGVESQMRLAGEPGDDEEPLETGGHTWSLTERPATADLTSLPELERWAERKGDLVVRAVLDAQHCVVVKKGQGVSVSVAGWDGPAHLSDLSEAMGRVPHDYVLVGWLAAKGLGGDWLPREALPGVLAAEVLASPIFMPRDLLALDGDLTEMPARERLELLRALVAPAGAHVVVPLAVDCRSDDDLEAAVDRVMAWRPSEGAGMAPTGVEAAQAGSAYAHGPSAALVRLSLRQAAFKDGFGAGPGPTDVPEGERLDRLRHGVQADPGFLTPERKDAFGTGDLSAPGGGAIAPGQGKFRRPVGKEFGDNVSVGVPLTMIPTRPSGSRREDEERSDPGGPLFPHFVGGPGTGVRKVGWTDEAREAAARSRASRARRTFAESMFRDAARRGIAMRDAVVLPGGELDSHLAFYRQKLTELGFKETGGVSLEDEDNPLVKDGAELNFEHADGRALNAYMRTDGKQVAITFDETPMDTGGELHRTPNTVPPYVRALYKAAWNEEDHPRDEGGKFSEGGPIDPRKEDKAHTFGGNLAIRHRVSLTLETLQYDKRTVSVSDLEVPPERRGKGLGAKIMRKITDYADRRGLRLTLDPALGGDAGGTTSRARLVRFYRQFGFVENKGRHADDSVNFEMYRLPAVRKEQWSGGGNNPADGDSFSVGPGVVGGHTFVVGQLKDGVYVADPKHPRVNPYEALFLKRGVALKAWSDEARAAALEARRQREDDRLADRFTERPADRRARLRGMRVDRETEDRVRAALGMRPRKSAAWDESEHPRDEGGKFSESGSAHPLLIQRFKTWHKADAAARQVALDTGREAEVYHDASAEAGRKYSIGLVPGRSEQARREGEDDDTYLARLIGKSAASEGDDRFRAEEGTANPDSRKPRKYPDVGEEMGWNDSYLSKSQVEFVRVFRAAGGWEESEHPRDEGGKFSETSGGAIGERHPDPDPVPGGHTTEELKTSLRDVSGEAFVSPDGQTYGATKDVIASHVEIARALGSNVSDLINAGYVRARVDSASVGVELDMRNPTAIGNAIALLQANPDAEFVHIDPSLTADKYVPARSFSGVRPAGDAARWLRSLLPVEKAEPDTKRVVKKRDIMWQVDEPAEVEPTEGEARGTDGKVRLKDCFRQAGRYVMTHLDSLVHGTVTIGPSVPVSHAWVEIRRPDGAELIYDGVQGKFYDKASYYRNMRAVPERTYDQAEAIAKMLETRHFGPWHRSAGL